MKIEIRINQADIITEMTLTSAEQEIFSCGIIHNTLIERWGRYPWNDLLYYSHVSPQMNRKYSIKRTERDLIKLQDRYYEIKSQAEDFIKDVKTVIDKYNSLKEQNVRIEAEIIKTLRIKRKERFTDLIATKKKPMFLLKDDKLYKIITEEVEAKAIKIAEKEAKRKYEELTEEIQILYTEYVSTLDRMYEEKVQELEERYKRLIPYWISKIYAKSGFEVTIMENADDYIRLSLRIFEKVKIKYLKYKQKKYKLKKELTLPITFVITTIYYDTKQAYVALYDKEGKRIEHYHSLNSNDCIGDLTNFVIESEDDYIEFIERLMQAITIINGDNIAIKQPHNLPHIDRLRRQAENDELEKIENNWTI